MTIKHQPATPLPWGVNLNDPVIVISDSPLVNADDSFVCDTLGAFSEVATQRDYDRAAYIAHAANAYPRLVEALQTLMQFNVTQGRKPDAWDAPLFSAVAASRALLLELGEE